MGSTPVSGKAIHNLYSGIPICPDNAPLVPLQINRESFLPMLRGGISYAARTTYVRAFQFLRPGQVPNHNLIEFFPNANDMHRLRQGARQAGALDICQKENYVYAVFSSEEDLSNLPYGKEKLASAPKEEMDAYSRVINQAREYMRTPGNHRLRDRLEDTLEHISARAAGNHIWSLFEEAMISFGRKDIAAWRWLGRSFYPYSGVSEDKYKKVALDFLSRAMDLIHQNDIELRAAFSLSRQAYIRLLIELITVAHDLEDFAAATKYLNGAKLIEGVDTNAWDYLGPEDKLKANPREMRALVGLLESPAAKNQTIKRRINALTWSLCPWIKPPTKTNQPPGPTNAGSVGEPSGTSLTPAPGSDSSSPSAAPHGTSELSPRRERPPRKSPPRPPKPPRRPPRRRLPPRWPPNPPRRPPRRPPTPSDWPPASALPNTSITASEHAMSERNTSVSLGSFDIREEEAPPISTTLPWRSAAIFHRRRKAHRGATSIDTMSRSAAPAAGFPFPAGNMATQVTGAATFTWLPALP